MSENIPESVPTSQDPRSKRPTKRRALTPNGQQAADVEALFANPDQEIVFPEPKKGKQLPLPPEIVKNVQGSSAGAGSGEFHVYKASRRREYERLRMLDEEAQKEKNEAEFLRDQEDRRLKDDEKTRKNREKRDKAKKRKARGKETTEIEDKKANFTGSKIGKGPRPEPGKTQSLEHGNDELNKQIQDGVTESSHEIGITIHDED